MVIITYAEDDHFIEQLQSSDSQQVKRFQTTGNYFNPIARRLINLVVVCG